ncbi:MAG: hypothetical protein RL681_516 [Candidatus Parcubacteria bacterium]|jgi:hypothetical protein
MHKARLVLVLFAGSVATAFGAVNPQTVTFENPLGSATFGTVATAVAKALAAFAIPILGIMVIWGGMQLITSGGAPDKISAGRKTLLYAVIGFAVVLLAEELPAMIEELLKP